MRLPSTNTVLGFALGVAVGLVIYGWLPSNIGGIQLRRNIT